MSPWCFARLASRIVSSDSSVEHASVVWMSPHFTMFGIVLSPFLRSRRLLAPAHENEIENEAEREGHEPGVGIQRVEKIRIGHLSTGRRSRPQEPGDHRKDSDNERRDRPPIETAIVGIAPSDREKIVEVELLSANDPVVRNEDSSDRS